HLPEDKRHLRFFQRVFIDERQVKSAVLFFVLHELFAVIDNARFDEFFEKVETLAGTFAYAGENGIAAVSFCDVVDKFLNKNGFANAGTAEEADLTAAKK